MAFAHLHVHTYYSILDGQASIKAHFKKAAEDNQPALAITDHGNVQGFPTAMLASEGLKEDPVKVLYGIEAYFVDDTRRAVFGHTESDFNDEFVVFDIETTGLSHKTCKIIEIGAVKIENSDAGFVSITTDTGDIYVTIP